MSRPSAAHSDRPGETRRRVLIIAGMHRSGTSALAGTLHHLGAETPRHLIPPNPNNPHGYFESEVLYPLHDQLLADAGSAWDQLRGPAAAWFGSAAADLWVDRLADVANDEFPDAPLLVFKDPRLCRLLPIWRRVFARLEIEPHYLIPVRNPDDVARSLQTASDVPHATGSLLWLDYFLRAEGDTRGERRGFVHYEALVADWQTEIARACAQAGVRLPIPDRAAEARVNDFLGRGSSTGGVATREAHPWVAAAYREAMRACEDDSPSAANLDEIRTAFAVAEAAFGPATASIESWLQTERDHRHTLETRVSSLQGELESRDNQRKELRERLARRREEARALGKTVELLMRWVLERTRDADKPASSELRAALAAIEKAEPAAIPQIASTAALLAEKNVQLADHERARASRAALLVEAGNRVAAAERELAQSQGRVSELDRDLENKRVDLDVLREQLAFAEQQLRKERTRIANATAEIDALNARLAEQLKSGSRWFARILKSGRR